MMMESDGGVYSSPSNVEHLTNPTLSASYGVDYFSSKKISLTKMSVEGISESDLNKQRCAQTLAGNNIWISKKYVEHRTKENILNSTVLYLLMLACENATLYLFVGQSKKNSLSALQCDDQYQN